ncbi:hypothetical protein [Nocardioides alcanivorans]|uniref:hypothetical protein n=1 Tax=Nocardioides alcanivorans TaxID=2897352 RepID=UPI001F3100AC|nr:hypothetical protein [Nocardioides alcanivorans]
MFTRPSPRALLVTGVVLLLVAGAAVTAWRLWPRPTEFESAVSMLPKQTQRVIWTDWAGVREELGAGDVSGTDSAAEEFLAEATDRELATSSLASSALLLADGFGFSPLAAEWEVFGQSAEGQVVVVRTEQDLGTVRDRVRDLGYTGPGKDELDGGVWSGGPDAVAKVTGLTAYQLQTMALFEDEGLIVGSDNREELEKTIKIIREGEGGVDTGELLEAAGEPLTATALLQDRACAELSLTQAAPDAQTTARALVEQAGGVSPLTGYVVALLPGDDLRVVFGFEDEERAGRNARSRAALARAEDPAQYVAYPEVFDLADSEADGSLVILTGKVRADAFPMSSLATGPVLLATC